MPSSIRQILEHIQRDFLWKGGNLEQKPHLVRWELVCLSKKKGGWDQEVGVLEVRGLSCWVMERIRMDWDIMGSGGGKSFLRRLHGKKVCGDVEDVVFWTKTKSGKFSVKSSTMLESGNPSLFPSNCIWNV
ncbi:hypothetical protein AAG906_017044 [Vitis piasezkii]